MENSNISFILLCICMMINPISMLQCDVSPVNVIRTGEMATFTCSTENNNSSIVFRKYGKRMTGISERQDGNRRIFEVRQEVTETDNFAIFKCSERFDNVDNGKLECELKSPLEIQAKAEIDPPYRILSRGGDAVFVCLGETVPQVTYYNWWVEKVKVDLLLPKGQFIKEDSGRTLRIRNVTEELHQSEIKCRVGNDVEDQRSRANAKSYLFIEGMAMPTNFTMNHERTTTTTIATPTATENNLLDIKLYFIIGAAGTLIFSIIFVCLLCVCKMKKDNRQQRKQSISKDPVATTKFDDAERARPNSYSELPNNTGKTIEPVTQWKVVTMDTFREEEPDFGPRLYPDLDEEEQDDTNIYENMDSLGNAKGARYSGYATMASVQPL